MTGMAFVVRFFVPWYNRRAIELHGRVSQPPDT